MTARASRRAAQFDFSSLRNIECLLIAQAAHEYGAVQSSWSTISKLMAKHALVSRPKNFFTPTLCSSIYEHLLQDAGLERTEAASAPKAPENLALAQKHFQIRFEELVDLIKAEETKFRTVVKEIEEIKAGHWDSSLKAKLSGTPASAIERGTTEDAPEATEDDADADADAASEAEEDVEETGEPEEEDAMDEDASQSAEEEAKSEAEDEADAGTEDFEEPPEDNSEVNESVPEAEETSKEAEGEAEEQSESSEDEPLQVVRRSTRRKSSAASTAPPVPSRGRRRQRAVKEEQESAAGSDAEAEPEASEDAGGGEEEAPSSPGAPRTRDGKRKAAFSDDARDSKRAREDSELPEEEGEPTTTTRASGRKGGQKVGPSPSASTAAGPALAPASTTATEGLPNKKFQNVIGLLHQQISTHRNGTIFHHPIKTSDAPDYYDIVKRPMDLKTVKQRVKDGSISNSLEFQRDVYLMFANAMMYNRPGSDVYTMAEDMMHDSELAIKNHKQTEGFRAQRS